MATRLPYYVGADDIYSSLMAQPSGSVRTLADYYPGLLGTATSGVTGGYDPGLYSRLSFPMAPQAAANVSGLLGGGNGGGDSQQQSSAWSQMSPAQQAAYYAANPTMAAITQALQKGFGFTTMGQLQRAAVPDFVREQQMIARGVDPTKSMQQAAIDDQTALANMVANERSMQSMQDALLADQNALSAMNQGYGAVDPGTGLGYDAAGFGGYGENAAPGGFESSMGFDVGGFGGYGENSAPGGFESSMGFDTGGFGSYGESSGYDSGGYDSGGYGGDSGGYGGDSGGYGGDSGGGYDSGGYGGDGGGYGYAKGGKVMMSGLLVDESLPGPDDGYAALQAGEYVIRKSATKKLGDKKLKALNEGRASIKMRKG